MNKGMMWFDDDKGRSIEEKITRAAIYYKEKYGRRPNLCCVNTNSIESDLKIDRIEVKAHKSIRPAHFWIGLQATS